MDVNSIADLTDEAGKKITGIEPGAGCGECCRKYDCPISNLEGWTVETSSSGAMTVALGQAIKNQEPIVFTGWTPHWMFAKYDLKYLEDPKMRWRCGRNPHHHPPRLKRRSTRSIRRQLDKFNWTEKDMEEVMLEINNGKDPQQAAREWIDKNQEKAASWKN